MGTYSPIPHDNAVLVTFRDEDGHVHSTTMYETQLVGRFELHRGPTTTGLWDLLKISRPLDSDASAYERRAFGGEYNRINMIVSAEVIDG